MKTIICQLLVLLGVEISLGFFASSFVDQLMELTCFDIAALLANSWLTVYIILTNNGQMFLAQF